MLKHEQSSYALIIEKIDSMTQISLHMKDMSNKYMSNKFVLYYTFTVLYIQIVLSHFAFIDSNFLLKKTNFIINYIMIII